jgi:hypothetical protein
MSRVNYIVAQTDAVVDPTHKAYAESWTPALSHDKLCCVLSDLNVE